MKLPFLKPFAKLMGFVNRRLLFPILVFIIPSFSIAQDDFIEITEPVQAVVMRSDGKQIAFADSQKLYLIDTERFSLTDSIALRLIPNTKISQLRYVESNPNMILAKYEHLNAYGFPELKFDYNEYPQDSIFGYDLQERSISSNRFPGNTYFSFAKTGGRYVYGYNAYFQYEQYDGSIGFSSRPGELMAYPEKNAIKPSGAIRDLKVSPANAEVAMILFDSTSKSSSKSHYTFEIRSLPVLNKKAEIKLRYLPRKLEFSADGKYVLGYETLDYEVGKPKERLHIFRTEDLSEIDTAKNTPEIPGLIKKGQIWAMEGNEVVRKNVANSQISNRIWSNLTPFFSISGFFPKDDKEIILYGEGSPYGSASGKNGFYLYNLENMAIYSSNEVIADEESLFDPGKIRVQNNYFKEGRIQTSVNGKLMLVNAGKSFQLWSIPDRKKIYDLKFERQIRTFLSHNNQSILIFENHEGKRFEEFKLRVLNLETGQMKNKMFEDLTWFSPVSSDNSSCECINSTSKPSEWHCFDGYGTRVFKIDSNKLTIEEVLNIENSNYLNTDIFSFMPVPGSENIFIGSFSDDFDLGDYAEKWKLTDNPEKAKDFKISLYNPDQGKIVASKLINRPGGWVYFPIGNDRYLFKERNGQISIGSLESNSTERLLNLTEKEFLEKILHTKDHSKLIIGRADYGDSLRVVKINRDTGKLLDRYSLPNLSDHHFITTDGLGMANSDRLTTYLEQTKSYVDWSNVESVFTSKTDLSVNKQGKLLFRNEWLIDLSTLEQENRFFSFQEAELFHNSGRMLSIFTDVYSSEDPYFEFRISSIENQNDIEWSSKKFKIKNRYSSFEKPDILVISPNDRYAVAFNQSTLNNESRYYLIDLKTGAVTFGKVPFELFDCTFSSNSELLVLSSNPNSLLDSAAKSHVISTADGKTLFKKPFKIESIEENDKMLFLDYQQLVVSQIESDDFKEGQSYFARSFLKCAAFLKDKNIYTAGDDSGTLFFWKPEKQSPYKRLNLGSSEIIGLLQSGQNLFVLLKNSEIKVVNLDRLELVATLSLFEKDNRLSMAWLSPSGHFKASKNDIRQFHFVKDGKIFPLLNYELFLNRPHLLMQTLGYSPSELIDLYEEAYNKRLQRSGFNSETDYWSIKQPSIELINRADLPLAISSPFIELNFKLNDQVDSLTIYSNGVPVKRLSTRNQNEVSFKLDLLQGLNRITTIGRNAEGLDSDPVSVEIEGLADLDEPTIHYVGIGVSKYSDVSMNLRYADEDVRRISDVMNRFFDGRISIDTLTNSDVTRANVLKLKDRLMTTSINDIVILSFSGHGMVDAKNDFYFATHDMDFKNPEKNGLSYGDIQELLDGIPARRKLLLLDACNSGEIDSEEDLQPKVGSHENVTTHLPEGAKGSVGGETTSGSGLGRSFDLMRTLFYDLDRGNGAFVISAAGGREFAFESPDWGNGVFTYSFINALYDLSGDSGYRDDGLIRISELRDYVYNKVTELTNGQQKPTARAENIEWDWILNED